MNNKSNDLAILRHDTIQEETIRSEKVNNIMRKKQLSKPGNVIFFKLIRTQ